MSRSAHRNEQRALAAELRDRGLAVAEIARVLRDRYGLTARLALRTACGMSQAEVAAAWTARWPDDPKSFKNISYWETWPSPTGHAPSLVVLDRLSQLYGCDVADLLAGWGEHASTAAVRDNVAEPEALAWQVEHLDLPELTRATIEWAARLPSIRRHDLLLKLSAAASQAAARTGAPSPEAAGNGPALDDLTGPWISSYTYFSTRRGQEFDGHHDIELHSRDGRLVGRSAPTSTGLLELDLRTDGLLVTGSWTERTAPDGYYRGAVYRGILQLVLDPVGRTMQGRWLGPDRDFAVDTGRWTLTRARSERVG